MAKKSANTIDFPTVAITVPYAQSWKGAEHEYVSDRFMSRLSQAQAHALHAVRHALIESKAQLKDGTPVEERGHVIQWILERVLEDAE